MKLLRPRTLFASLALFAATLAAPAAESGFTQLFNGKDLSGWDGLKEFWSVRDGAIVGQTKDAKDLKANTFLVWTGGQPANFELRLNFRLTAQNERNQANSGVQYRSRVIDPATFVVGGYQADIDSTGKYAGMLYEEKGRGILMAPGEKVRITAAPVPPVPKQKATIEKLGTPSTAAEVLAAYKLGEWNELVIIAKGNRLQHFLNGKLSADVTDDDPAVAPKSGVIALQLHTGPAMTVEFKNLRLKNLP